MDEPGLTRRRFGRRHAASRRVSIAICIVFLGSIICAPALLAQGDSAPRAYEQADLSKTDGLPSNSVYALALDDDGYLWAGTLGGLARFDGFDFDLVLSPNRGALESNRVRSLLVDREGALWIGSDNGPLIRKQGDQFERIVAAEKLRAMHDLLEASDGTIWGAGSSIVRWRDGEATLLGPKYERPRARFDSLVEDADGVIWATSNQGLARIHGDAVETVDSRAAAGFFHDPFGGIWVTLPAHKAYRLDDPERVEIDVPFGLVFSDIVIRERRRMLATDAGLMITRPVGNSDKDFVFEPLGGLDRDVRCLLKGAHSAAWFGSDRFGLSYVRPRRFSRVVLPESAPDSAVQEIQRLDEQTALVGSTGRGKTWIVSTVAPPEILESAAGSLVGMYAAIPYVDGTAWVATATGLARLRGRAVDYIAAFARPARSIVRADDGSVWVQQGTAFVEVLPDGTPGRTVEDIDPRTHGATPARGGFVFIGGEVIVHVETSTATARVVFEPRHARSRAIVEDDDGALWITTYGSGLFRLQASGEVDHWTTQDGLPGDFLGWVGLSVGADGQGLVWLNSNRGLVRVEIESLDRVDSSSSDGLRSQLIACGESSGGAGAMLENDVMLLPTLEGLVSVDPRQLRTEQDPPRVAIEWVEIDGEQFTATSRPRGSVDLAVGYTAILFPRSTDARFQYRLEGHDDAWIDANRERVARYTNIPPGDYTFRVRARAAGGPWSRAAAIDGLSVAPRWFQQRLNQVLLAVGLIALLTAAYGLRTRGLMRRSRVLAREVDHRRLVEEQLRASEANYVSVLDSAHDGIVMIEADGKIGLANAAMCRMFGYTREEIVGRSATWLGLPDEFNTTERMVDDDSGVIAMREFQEHWKTQSLAIPRKDGSPLDVELSVARETFRGRPRLVGIVRDVSERLRMMDRLRESEQRYRQLFRTAPTAIIAWQPDRQIIDWNERAVELFGWTHDASPALGDLFASNAAGDLMGAAVEAVLAGRRDAALVYPTRIKADDERRCRWTFAPITGADGDVHTVISLVTDVTDDERVERAMEGLRRKLARAEETERSRIARELHDDLSQRLAALAIEMQLLENGIEQRPVALLRAAIRNVHLGLDEISTDVHTLSRQLHPTVLDDLGLSRALRSECQRRRRSSGVSIHFVDNSQDMDVRNEVGLALFRIAQESVQNAIKHASAQEIVVRLAANAGSIELTISDDGVGFDAERVTTDSGGGLGLASVQERARLIGADLEVNSAPGQGTSISITATLRPATTSPS